MHVEGKASKLEVETENGWEVEVNKCLHFTGLNLSQHQEKNIEWLYQQKTKCSVSLHTKETENFPESFIYKNTFYMFCQIQIAKKKFILSHMLSSPRDIIA